MHTILRCEKPGCNGVVGILPGRWRIVRALKAGERVDAGHANLACGNPDCMQKYDVVQVMRVAA